MQPEETGLDRSRDAADEIAAIYADPALRKMITDDRLRELGYKEYRPGYFYDDPRHPHYSPEDRYLMDHPGPDWKTKPSLADQRPQLRALREADLAGAQYSGGEIERTSSLPLPRPPAPFPVASLDEEEPQDSRMTGLWVCRLCRKDFARWPTERAWRRDIFGLRLTIIFRSPLACTNCRLHRQKELVPLAREEYRPFWKNVIAVWEGVDYPTSPSWVQRASRFRKWLLTPFSRQI